MLRALKLNSCLLLLAGDYGTVEAVVVIDDANQPMYNLTVDEAHTFFVGEGDWLVHNIDCIIERQRRARDLARQAEEIKQAYRSKHNGAFPDATFGVAEIDNQLYVSIGAEEDLFMSIQEELPDLLSRVGIDAEQLPNIPDFDTRSHHAEEQIFNYWTAEIGDKPLEIGISNWNGLCDGCQTNFSTRDVVLSYPPNTSPDVGQVAYEYNLFYKKQIGIIKIWD